MYDKFSRREEINIPAYNIQNGYYSDKIALQLTLFDYNEDPNAIIDIDMTGITQDEIS